MSLAHLLARHAQLTPDRAAIFNGTVFYATYGQWAERSAALAHRKMGTEERGTCRLSAGPMNRMPEAENAVGKIYAIIKSL